VKLAGTVVAFLVVGFGDGQKNDVFELGRCGIAMV
jgi:hypothetical protein